MTPDPPTIPTPPPTFCSEASASTTSPPSPLLEIRRPVTQKHSRLAHIFKRGRGSGTRWHKLSAHTCTPTVTVGSSEPPEKLHMRVFMLPFFRRGQGGLCSRDGGVAGGGDGNVFFVTHSDRWSHCVREGGYEVFVATGLSRRGRVCAVHVRVVEGVCVCGTGVLLCLCGKWVGFRSA